MTDTPRHRRIRRLAVLISAVMVVVVVGMASASGTKPSALRVDSNEPRPAPDAISGIGPECAESLARAREAGQTVGSCIEISPTPANQAPSDLIDDVTRAAAALALPSADRPTCNEGAGPPGEMKVTSPPPLLTQGQAVVSVSERQFMIIVDDEVPELTYSDCEKNGLIEPLPHGAAIVTTGISAGSINVAVEGLASAPPVADGWEEIVEISVKAEAVLPNSALSPVPLEERRAAMVVNSLMSDRPDLPVLNPGGPGDYRVRVHANHRGHNWDGVDFNPVEQYLIQVWPSPPAPETLHKVSDNPRLNPRLRPPG